MIKIQVKHKSTLLFFLIVVLLLFLLVLPINFETSLGTGDFRPYWSASYLLRHGQDFSDPALMDHIERTLTGWDKPFTMMAWFAPTGMVVLLPFTLLPFEKAALLWLLINILILCITAFLLWKKDNRKIWIPLLAIFAFPMTLLSLYVGQINTLVLFGLAIYLSLEKSKHQYLRGVGLALTTIKPHLVILTLPLIILDCIHRKQWKILIGFLGSLFFSAIILFAFYSPWISSFWNLISSGMSTLRETPTISGLIVHITGQGWGKWLWIPGLLIITIFWWIKKENSEMNKFIHLTLIAGFIISPIGWSYDQIVLIIPILYFISTVINGKNKIRQYFFIIFISMFYLISLLMRVLSKNDFWFFIFPFVLIMILLCNYITSGLSNKTNFNSEIEI